LLLLGLAATVSFEHFLDRMGLSQFMHAGQTEDPLPGPRHEKLAKLQQFVTALEFADSLDACISGPERGNLRRSVAPVAACHN
jgi:hypothetical protein